MGEGPIGRAEWKVRPTREVARAGSATDRHPRRDQQDQQDQKDAHDRRRKEPPNPRRRRVYELLFDEVDQIDGLSDGQRARVKDNIRSHVVSAVPPTTPTLTAPRSVDSPSVEDDEEQAAARLLADPQAPLPVDHDHVVQAAAPVHPHLPLSVVEENRLLAEQLRVCLAQHTDRARKLAVYLHMLLRMNGEARPTMVLDV